MIRQSEYRQAIGLHTLSAVCLSIIFLCAILYGMATTFPEAAGVVQNGTPLRAAAERPVILLGVGAVLGLGLLACELWFRMLLRRVFDRLRAAEGRR
ncbi:MAG: hypothetical protein AAGC57_15220 [Pseudomonadota bacterium]